MSGIYDMLPGPKTFSLSIEKEKKTIIYVRNVLNRNYVVNRDVEEISDYISKINEVKKDYKICLSFLGIHTINQRFMKKMIDSKWKNDNNIDFIYGLNNILTQQFFAAAKIEGVEITTNN